jgi:transposase
MLFHMGGVPSNIWYDNLSLAVKHLLKGKGHRVEEQESFIAFRSHYLFQSCFCNRGEAHEKGLVENLVGYARLNFLVPLPKVSSFQELKQLLLERCLREYGRRLRGRTKTIGELWQEERARLLPLLQDMHRETKFVESSEFPDQSLQHPSECG